MNRSEQQHVSYCLGEKMENTAKSLFCIDCSQQFDKKAFYDMHLSSVHKIVNQPDDEKKLTEIKKEDNCLMAKSDGNSVKQIAKLRVKQQEKKQHKCSICEYTYFSKPSLKRHIQSVHEGKKTHKCSICDHSTLTKQNLNTHIKSVHERRKPYTCTICEYSASQKGHLKKHIDSVHEVKKPITCPFCDYSTSLKITWKNILK